MKDKSNIYSRYFTYIKPVTKIPIIRTYGSTIFTIIAITIFIFFAIKPTVETILVLQKKLENSDEVLQKITQKSKDLTLGKQNYQNLDQATKDKINQAIPDSINLKSLLGSLEQSAQKNNASISAIQLQPTILETKKEDALGTLSEVSFTFNAEGSYPTLISLLQDLKSSSRLISIESLSLSKVSEGANLVMSINGKVYYLK